MSKINSSIQVFCETWRHFSYVFLQSFVEFFRILRFLVSLPSGWSKGKLGWWQWTSLTTAESWSLDVASEGPAIQDLATGQTQPAATCGQGQKQNHHHHRRWKCVKVLATTVIRNVHLSTSEGGDVRKLRDLNPQWSSLKLFFFYLWNPMYFFGRISPLVKVTPIRFLSKNWRIGQFWLFPSFHIYEWSHGHADK